MSYCYSGGFPYLLHCKTSLCYSSYAGNSAGNIRQLCKLNGELWRWIIYKGSCKWCTTADCRGISCSFLAVAPYHAVVGAAMNSKMWAVFKMSTMASGGCGTQVWRGFQISPELRGQNLQSGVFLVTHILLLFQLFKRRNVELINEDAAMFDSPLVDSFVSSSTAGVSALGSCCVFPYNEVPVPVVERLALKWAWELLEGLPCSPLQLLWFPAEKILARSILMLSIRLCRGYPVALCVILTW